MFIVFGKKAFYAIFALLLVLTAATVSLLLPPVYFGNICYLLLRLPVILALGHKDPEPEKCKQCGGCHYYIEQNKPVFHIISTYIRPRAP